MEAHPVPLDFSAMELQCDQSCPQPKSHEVEINISQIRGHFIENGSFALLRYGVREQNILSWPSHPRLPKCLGSISTSLMLSASSDSQPIFNLYIFR